MKLLHRSLLALITLDIFSSSAEEGGGREGIVCWFSSTTGRKKT
jgi:hypothetical protein